MVAVPLLNPEGMKLEMDSITRPRRDLRLRAGSILKGKLERKILSRTQAYPHSATVGVSGKVADLVRYEKILGSHSVQHVALQGSGEREIEPAEA
jgi:hypothetical protein